MGSEGPRASFAASRFFFLSGSLRVGPSLGKGFGTGKQAIAVPIVSSACSNRPERRFKATAERFEFRGSPSIFRCVWFLFPERIAPSGSRFVSASGARVLVAVWRLRSFSERAGPGASAVVVHPSCTRAILSSSEGPRASLAMEKNRQEENRAKLKQTRASE